MPRSKTTKREKINRRLLYDALKNSKRVMVCVYQCRLRRQKKEKKKLQKKKNGNDVGIARSCEAFSWEVFERIRWYAGYSSTKFAQTLRLDDYILLIYAFIVADIVRKYSKQLMAERRLSNDLATKRRHNTTFLLKNYAILFTCIRLK